MIRVRVVVEGQSEESFVSSVLAPAFCERGIFLTPLILGVPGHKGGRTNYARVRKDVLLNLKQEKSAYCSTMLDYYGLGAGFPGTPVAGGSSIQKVSRIEEAMKADICAQIPEHRPDIRFLPYIQLHEFEGLLFSNLAGFASGINQAHLAASFRTIRDSFATPEDINDAPLTAPRSASWQRARGIGRFCVEQLRRKLSAWIACAGSARTSEAGWSGWRGS